MISKLLTYEQQLDLVKQKLAVVSRNEELGLDTFKYHRSVMYDYLWKQYPEMLECRGHTYDINTGEIAVAAPTKSFNYLEDAWWNDIPLNTKVIAFKKYNGFMGCVSIHNNKVIFSTTGSTKSEYVKLLEKEFYKTHSVDLNNIHKNKITYLYEVIHKDDPHIVDEQPGLVLLGLRYKESGLFIPIVSSMKESDTWYRDVTLGSMLEVVKEVKHEGFMLYADDGKVCKLKSPYYVGKKKLMRMNESRIKQMYYGKPVDGLPIMWYDAVNEIKKNFTAEEWYNTSEQDRRKFLEELE